MGTFIEMNSISKTFSGVEVLHNVDFELDRGEIRALLGSNGAGKSTLIKILSGIYTKSSGEIKIDGNAVDMKTPLMARECGIVVVPQELNLVPTLTVLQNVFLGSERKKGFLLDEKSMLEEYQCICEDFDFNLPPHAYVGNLPAAQQQMIEIMKGLRVNARLIVMDEPTTSLTDREKLKLFQIIKKLKERGTTVIYISHILSEIFELSDRVTILRDGRLVGTFPTKELTVDAICDYMSGDSTRERKNEQKTVSICKKECQPVLEVSNLCRKDIVKNVSFQVYPGEVVGLAGLVGSGRTEIVRALFGADTKTSGTIKIDGNEVSIKNPSDSVKNGIGFVTEDRKREGLVLQLPIYQNATLVRIQKMKKHGVIEHSKEITYMRDAMKKLSIKEHNIKDVVSHLSGGNQQKVVIAKWLLDNLRVIIFDEPTKGIDINAKEDVFKIIQELTKQGVAVIFISSVLDEVFRVADRILVVNNGSIVRDMENHGVTENEVLSYILQDHEEKGRSGHE